MRHLAKTFEVAGILMHGNLYDSAKYSEYLILCFCTLFELEVFVPEGMGQEVKSYIGSATFKQPMNLVLAKLILEEDGCDVWRSANTRGNCA